MKVAIIGSRNYPRRDLVLDLIKKLPKGTVIVSGGARGVDTSAEEGAKAFGLQTQIFYADWNHLGRSAGYVRNVDIVNTADKVVAFWDGTSKGTKHTIDIARKAGKLTTIVGPDGLEHPWP